MSKNHYASFQKLRYLKRLENDLQYGNQELLDRITGYFSTKKTIKRGDVISLVRRDKKYRNDWTYMWDGTKAVELETEYDDYGHVPKEFMVGEEFTPDHWVKTITHNQIFHLSNEIKSQMTFLVDDENDVPYADVTIQGEHWRCYAHGYDNENFDEEVLFDTGYFSMEPGDLEGLVDGLNGNVFYAYMPLVSE